MSENGRRGRGLEGMRLEVAEYPVARLELGSKTRLEGTRLTVNPADLEAIAGEVEGIEGIVLGVA